jgi:hypothetical protein
VLPEPLHDGVLPEHMLPQLPQFAVVAIFVSHPRSGLLKHCVQPGAQEDTGNVQAPDAEQVTAPLT